jgi:nitrate/nitrite-specific signal transduction histidine kinase
MKKQSNPNPSPNPNLRPESKTGRMAVFARTLLTFRFMLVTFFMLVMAASGFVTGMIFVLGYLARFQPIHGLPITTLISTPVIISVLLSFVIITVWSGRFFRPLKRITEATKKVGKGDFSDKGISSNLTSESITLYRNDRKESACNKVSVQQNMIVEKSLEKKAAETAQMILDIRD